MPPDTPLSQLVLWVPPAIASGWERLAPERQRWWTEQLTYFWLELITAPGPEPVLSRCGLLRSHAQYEAFQLRMAEIDAQFPRVQALPPDLPPIPRMPVAPIRPQRRPLPPMPPRGCSTEEHDTWMATTRLTPDEQAAETAYEAAYTRYHTELLAVLDQLNARNAVILKHQQEPPP